jgi:uncharacterized protein (TIGR02147 family)
MTVFEFESYKDFINSYLDDPARGGGYGSRAKLAKAIHCQTSYVAQVLNGRAHFSLEQIEDINEFLGHSEQEGHILLLLVQLERAGTKKLKNRFSKQINEILESRKILKNRLGVKQPLTLELQATYYSQWYFSVIHVMAAQERFQSTKAIAEYLNLELSKVNAALAFLFEINLLEKTSQGKIKTGKTSIHLGTDSPLIVKHHTNWRLQAVRSLERHAGKNLNYSSVTTLSETDAGEIRELLTKTIEKSKKIIKDSPDERVYSFCLDFFEI